MLLTGLDLAVIESLGRAKKIPQLHVNPFLELAVAEKMHRLVVDLDSEVFLLCSSISSRQIFCQLDTSHELLVSSRPLEPQLNGSKEILKGSIHISRNEEAQQILCEVNLSNVSSLQLLPGFLSGKILSTCHLFYPFSEIAESLVDGTN